MTDPLKLRLDLPLVLPDVDDAKDRCVTRLIASMSGRPGIAEAHVMKRAEGELQLCVHYDPATIPLARVRELVQSVGAQLTSRFAHLSLKADAPLHARAARGAADTLRRIPGVLEAELAPSGALRIEYDRTQVTQETLLGRAAKLGVRSDKAATGEQRHDHGHEAGLGHAEHHDRSGGKAQQDKPHQDDHDHDHDAHAAGKDGGHEHDHGAHGDDKEGHAGHDHAHGGPLGEQSELIFAILAGVFLLAGWLIEPPRLGPGWLPTACYVTAYLFGGFFTVKEAIDNLRARRFEIDTLMLVAAVGAAALGKWAEGALLLFLFSLGHSLEHYAMGRARKAIEALAELAPETATVRRDDRTEEVAVGALQVGDVVLVRPNERLPADGVVVVGNSSVNQAPVTGESVPVDKRPSDDAKAALAAFDRVGPENRVFAGTINGSGAIEVMVARRAEQSTMARVVKMVTEAEAQRSPTQQFTERFERIFVPAGAGAGRAAAVRLGGDRRAVCD